MLVNRAHRKCRKRSANLQLQDDHRDLPGAGPDGDLAFEIGGVRLGEELLNKRGDPASGLNVSGWPRLRAPPGRSSSLSSKSIVCAANSGFRIATPLLRFPERRTGAMAARSLGLVPTPVIPVP